MPTKSIRLSDEEAESLRVLRAETGESEAALLRQATRRGLHEIRLERGLMAYLGGAPSHDAAMIAGLPRAAFPNLLAERGITMLHGPSTLASELDYLARVLDRPRLATVAASLVEPEQ